MRRTGARPHRSSCSIIGNCGFSALIDKKGSIVWSCLPRFDGDPVFNGLLDASANGNFWSIEIDDFARSEQHYEANTAVLRTSLFDGGGRGVEIADFALSSKAATACFIP